MEIGLLRALVKQVGKSKGDKGLGLVMRVVEGKEREVKRQAMAVHFSLSCGID